MAEGEVTPGTFDPEADRYPNFYEALARITDEGGLPDEPIMRLEVTTLANGEITYRFWPVGAEDPEGGVLFP